MILSCQNICKAFGEKVILNDASFHIEDREKAALIGCNGAGKTTLLRIIMQELSADSGTVVLARDKNIGYLAQYQDIHGHHTIYEELLTTKQHIIDMERRIRNMEQEMNTVTGDDLNRLMETYTRLTHQFELENGYAYKSELTGVLKGLGFTEEDYDKQIETLSGGQKTRVALGKMLLSKPDILLLDEPTNHLDMESISWLETYLLNYPGAVFIVSHDRYFLDKVVTKVIEIEAGQTRVYSGNYSAYALKKAQLRDAQYKAYLNQQRDIKHQEAVIAKLKSFNREKSIKRAESREKMLEKTERLEKPQEVNAYMHLSLIPDVQSGNDVLHIEGLSKAFGEQRLFSNIDIDIKRSEKVALIGDNGTGKTTILNILGGMDTLTEGKVLLDGKEISSYGKKQLTDYRRYDIGFVFQFYNLVGNLTALENVELASQICSDPLDAGQVLADVGLADRASNFPAQLSGGEQQRVAIARALAKNPKLLLCDEPTGALDYNTGKAVLKLLQDTCRKKGVTVVVITHNQAITAMADRIITVKNGTVTDMRKNEHIVPVEQIEW